MQSERELVLGAIKKSLRRGDVRPSKPHGEGHPREDVTEGLDTLIFSSLKAVGGVGHHAESAREVAGIVTSIAETRNVKSAIIAENEEIKEMGIGRALEEAGVGVRLWPMDRGAASREEVKDNFKTPDMGITPVFYGLAESGTMVLKGGSGFMRYGSLLPPIHIGVLLKDRLVYDFRQLGALLKGQGNLPSKPGDWMVFITGPSRTGDIEATISLGVHGPRETHLILFG